MSEEASVTPMWMVRNVPTELVNRVSAAARARKMTIGKFLTPILEAALREEDTSAPSVDLAALRAEFEELKRKLNAQGHALLNLGDHVAKLARTPAEQAEIEKWFDETRRGGW